jgi:hypothetical protein
VFDVGDRVCHKNKVSGEKSYGNVTNKTISTNPHHQIKTHFKILWECNWNEPEYADWELVQMGVHKISPLNGIKMNQVIFDEIPITVCIETFIKEDCTRGFHSLHKYVGITDSYLFCDCCNYKERT